MRLKRLRLSAVGPFHSADIEFGHPDGGPSNVTIFTGENGTGKSVILDSLRAMFPGHVSGYVRPLYRPLEEFSLRCDYEVNGLERVLRLKGTHPEGSVSGLGPARTDLVLKGRRIADYWSSALATDEFSIDTLKGLNHKDYWMGALTGIPRNADIAHMICHVDYLRQSEDRAESAMGTQLYDAIKAIASEAVAEGEFSHVRRSSLDPIFKVRGRELTAEYLSAGSQYLMQRMVRVLQLMYSAHVTWGKSGDDDVRGVPGVLIIDEAENHLHPKWQKRLLPAIGALFPNLQLIVATHSPFIVNSVSDARVYVCQSVPEEQTCIVSDVTADFTNQPVDEVLASPAFAGTWPFSTEITELLEKRKAAIEAGDRSTQRDIERQLVEANPDYFGVFNLPSILRPDEAA